MNRKLITAGMLITAAVVILAALGGVMVPHFLMPSTLQTLAQASPLYWGHQAYLDVFLQGASVRDIALPLTILGGMGTFCLLLSARRVAA